MATAIRVCSKQIYPKCGVLEKRISHQFFSVQIHYFHLVQLTFRISNMLFPFSFLQTPLHKENIQKGLKKLTNIDRHGSTTFLETINQMHGISYCFDIIVCEHYWEIKFRKANERNIEPKMNRSVGRLETRFKTLSYYMTTKTTLFYRQMIITNKGKDANCSYHFSTLFHGCS